MTLPVLHPTYAAFHPAGMKVCLETEVKTSEIADNATSLFLWALEVDMVAPVDTTKLGGGEDPRSVCAFVSFILSLRGGALCMFSCKQYTLKPFYDQICGVGNILKQTSGLQMVPFRKRLYMA